MAFEIVDRQPGGTSGQISIGLAGEATEVWTIVADNYNHSTEDLRLSGIFPEVFTSFHPQNSRLRLQPIDIEQNEDNPALFTATIKWSSEKMDPKDEEEKEDDPLNRKARVTVSTGFTKETKHRDARGVPKVNFAGDLFDPPIESNSSHLVIKIRKNVTIFPDWAFEYSDAVNSVAFNIKGRTIDKGCAWIAYIELGEENTDGPVPYCEALIEMHVRKKRKPYGDETIDDVPDPWVTEQLNEGLMQKVTVGGVVKRQRIMVLDDSTPPQTVNAPSPVPLDFFGRVLDPVTEETLTWLTFHDHPELDFNAISYLWSNA